MRKLAKALMVSVDYLADENITDPTYGLKKKTTSRRPVSYTATAAEVNALLERNAEMGGELSQEAKDAYFEAVMKAYLACKEKAFLKHFVPFSRISVTVWPLYVILNLHEEFV